MDHTLLRNGPLVADLDSHGLPGVRVLRLYHGISMQRCRNPERIPSAICVIALFPDPYRLTAVSRSTVFLYSDGHC